MKVISTVHGVQVHIRYTFTFRRSIFYYRRDQLVSQNNFHLIDNFSFMPFHYFIIQN